MTTNHERPAGVPKPASPLPYALDDDGDAVNADGSLLLEAGDLGMPLGFKHRADRADERATLAYIVHAANALPGVVEERDELATDNIALLEDNDALRSELAKREREAAELRAKPRDATKDWRGMTEHSKFELSDESRYQATNEQHDPYCWVLRVRAMKAVEP